LVRDAGINSTFFNNVTSTSGTGAPSLAQNSEVTDTAALGVRYAATAKIAAKAGYQYRHGKILNTTTQSDQQTDNWRTASLGLTYDVTRNVQLSCTYSRESRSLSASALGTDGFSYTANVTGCMAQVVLR
jgi:long-subunit fatty acid transport protein